MNHVHIWYELRVLKTVAHFHVSHKPLQVKRLDGGLAGIKAFLQPSLTEQIKSGRA